MRKILFEEEDELLLLSGKPEAVVPLVLYEEEGSCRAELWAGARKFTEEILAESAGVFSAKTLRALDRAYTPYLDSLGYERDRYGMFRWYRQYRAECQDDINKTCILPSTVLLDKPVKSLISIDGETLARRAAPAFVTVADGCIVSCATVNDYNDDDAVLEITVETAASYRKHGFAASNTAALSAYLTGMGYSVAYCFSRWNRASDATAKKAGLRRFGRFYAVTAYKK